MSLWRDDKYLRLLSPQLDRFVQKAAHTYNFRCPLCGDSEKNQYKSRGYMFAKADVLMFKCHNCSVALPFSALLKRLSRHLYDQYILERLKEGTRDSEPDPMLAPKAPAKASTAPTACPVAPPHCLPLSAVKAPEHPLHGVYRFAIDTRKLPESVIDRFYATDKAHTVMLPLVGEEKASKVADGIVYLIQPLCDPKGRWYGAQLRMLARKEFLTFRWAHDTWKLFGLEAWNPAKLTYVIEGPIDALFVPNSLSPCGSDLLTGVRFVAERFLDTRFVYVWDNEPRNAEVCHHIQTAIRLQESVVIWPRDYPKDINDMVRAGIDVNAVLLRRTFTGLSAELEFSSWKR